MTIKGNRRTPRIDSARDERRRGAGVSARQSGLAEEADFFYGDRFQDSGIVDNSTFSGFRVHVPSLL